MLAAEHRPRGPNRVHGSSPASIGLTRIRDAARCVQRRGGVPHMRAAILDEHGGTPQVGEFEAPEPAPGALVVDVHAAGLNPVDLAVASGRFYGAVPPLPSVVGREGVGADGSGRRGYFLFGVPPFGSMAERSLVPEAAFIPIPDEIDAPTAIALGIAGLAAWVPLTLVARVREGDSVLVLGAGGAVGRLAVQAARLAGAGRVVGAARSDAGRARALELGADAAVGLDPKELSEAGGPGFDVILDTLWGEPALAALQAIASWGRMVQVGNAAGPEITLPAAVLRARCATVTGFTSALVNPPDLARAYLELVDHAIQGRLRVDTEVLPLADVSAAWKRQQEGPDRKLVIEP
jgi:NADPH:quinone reductase-like Zn-dependent oxidoreductase